LGCLVVTAAIREAHELYGHPRQLEHICYTQKLIATLYCLRLGVVLVAGWLREKNLPRRRPPVDIFTFPVPDYLMGAAATCPACSGIGKAFGCVGARMVFKCTECGVRFKVDQPGYGLGRGEPRAS
jgi:hypothetical protein